MKSVPVTPGIEGKEGGGRCRNKPQKSYQQLQLLHLAVQEQWRSRGETLRCCAAQSIWLWLPACPTRQPPALQEQGEPGSSECACRDVAGVKRILPTAFHAEPVCVLGDLHLATQSRRLLRFPVAFPIILWHLPHGSSISEQTEHTTSMHQTLLHRSRGL